MPDIKSSVSYIKDLPLYQHEKPYCTILPAGANFLPQESKAETTEFEWSETTVQDIRGREADYKLDVAGFQILSHASQNIIFDTGDDVEAYCSEVADFLKEAFQAETVLFHGHQIRKNTKVLGNGSVLDLNNPTNCLRPANHAHVDQTFVSGPEIIREKLIKAGLEKYLTPKYRFRIVNSWRSLNPVLEDAPLAVCDYRSVDKNDLMAADRITPTKAREVYFVKKNPNHKWYYLDQMNPSELLLILMYDSGSGDHAKYCPHTSVPNPNASPNSPPRHSIETRNIIITAA